jgi:hypothetical protein
MESNTLLREPKSDATTGSRLNGAQNFKPTTYASANPGPDPTGVREEAFFYERDYSFSLSHPQNYKHSFYCPMLNCKENYANARELELHLWGCHPERGLQPRPFFCQRCGDTFLTEERLLNHLESSLHHLDGRPLRELRPAPPRPLEAPQAPAHLAASELAEIAEVLELAEVAEKVTAYEQLGPAAYASEWTEASFIVTSNSAGPHWSDSNDESMTSF